MVRRRAWLEMGRRKKGSCASAYSFKSFMSPQAEPTQGTIAEKGTVGILDIALDVVVQA